MKVNKIPSMTITFVAVTLCTMVCISTPIDANNAINKFADTLQSNTKSFIKSCQTKTGATRADLESLKARKIPQTKTGQCFLQCIFNSVKLMDEGKFNKQGMVVAFAPAMKGDLSKISKLRKLSEVCEKEIGGKNFKNCEGPTKIVECVAKNGPEYGIEFPRAKDV